MNKGIGEKHHLMFPQLMVYAVTLVFLFLVEGCYTTVVRVETTPPGAAVHYDFEPQGVTPAEFNVDWYGKHKVTLDHPELGRRVEYVDLRAPAYMWFPLDFFVAILPFKITDRQEFSFDLTETPESSVKDENDEEKDSQ